MKNIIGISCFFHDSAAALLCDGHIIGAVQEERFTRKKHDASFPFNALSYLLNSKNLKLNEIDKIIFYDKPILKFERLIESYLSSIPFGFNSFKIAIPIWLREKLFLKDLLIKEFKKFGYKVEDDNILFSEHHFSHAASAFYPSGFNEAVILCNDGVGEWATSTVSYGKENKLKVLKEIHFPSSIGLLYSAFTYYLGFKVNSGEYKVMGLAPYGTPKYTDIIFDKLIDLKEDGSFCLDQKYFNYIGGLTMVNKNFADLFKHPLRDPNKTELSQFHMDIAASIQRVNDIVVLKMVKDLSKNFKSNNLCMAGGVALNCVTNGKLLESNYFKNIWIQPAAGDAGGALGAALGLWHNEYNKKRTNINKDIMSGAFLGPSYSDEEIERVLIELGANYTKYSENELINEVAHSIDNGMAIGWFQGRMEFGPRSLGSRSIIADPRSNQMQKNLNLKVKYRESFRPFAPSILAEDCKNWFNLKNSSPYMLFVAQLNKKLQLKLKAKDKKLFGIDKLNIKRSNIPAVTHVDYSARVQTVHKSTNKLFYKLISRFKEISGCPCIINTSFNVRGEPIVCTPEDAFNCFMGTDLDILAIGNFFLKKSDQPKNLSKSYFKKFELD